VSWSRESESAQLVGRVIDPSVREDGEPEPDVQLAPSHGRLEPSAPAPSSELAALTPAPELPTPPAEVGSRVDTPPEPGSNRPSSSGLEGAHVSRVSSADNLETGNQTSRPPVPWSDEFGVSSRDRELDLIGTEPMRISAPAAPSLHPEHRLSPTWTAIFATLLGLCTVATFIAIAIHLDRRQPRSVETQAKVAEALPASASAPPPVVDRRPLRTKLSGPWRIHDSEKDPASRIIDGKVGLDPLVKSVEKAGVPLKQFYRVIAAFSRARPLTNCGKSDRYIVLLDRGTKRIKAFEYLTNPEEVFQAKEGADGFLAVQKLDLQVKQARVSSALVVGDDGLEAAVIAGGLEKALLGTLREALSGHAALEELERGTRVRMIAQEITVLGDFARYAGIEAMEIDYAGTEHKRERIYYFNGSDSRGYFDSQGRAPYSGGWRKPIPSAPITSKFNPKRFHPILKRIMPHEGIDFGAPMGTPVGASSFGEVTFVGFAGATGNFVRLSHPGDIETGYAHLSRFAEGLKVGDKVKRLQVVGYVGSTGRSTGPHLHFSAKRAGKFFDPETLNLDGLRTLAANERPQFEQVKTEYDKMLEGIALPPVPALNNQPPGAPSTTMAEGDELEGPALPTASTTPAPATNAQSGTSPGGNAVYLTDDELKKSQNATDDGEVAE
jgi:murein DD-endopeptidase MepM/ murein hydrolase activator NlpD